MLTTEGRVSRRNYRNVAVKPENVTPLYDNLLVRRIYDAYEGQILEPSVEKTADGRWVKKTDSGPRKGVVVAVGRGDKVCVGVNQFGPWEVRKSMAVRTGDTIIYPRFESSHVVIDGQPYTFVREADVMAVIEP